MENAYYMLAGKPERKEKKMTVFWDIAPFRS
jgi:hypothetical protein